MHETHEEGAAGNFEGAATGELGEGVGTGGRLGVHGCEQQWQGRVQEGWVTPGLMTSLDYLIRK